LDAIFDGSGYFNHAQTYSHTPVVTAAGLATVRYIKNNHLVARAAEMGAILGEGLAQLKKYSCVGDVRGKGLMWAVEFVKDQKTKEPFSRSEKWVEKFTDKAFESGLILWPNVGHVDGTNGDLVMVSPPFTINADEIGELLSLFKQTVEQML
jgi:adenosylmethionine-8-amino-7-oxononanoate aminotransferase